MAFPGGYAPTAATEDQYLRLKIEAAKARYTNPVESPSLLGGRPWLASGGAWASTTAYTIGQTRVMNGKMGLCIGGGTSGSSAPTLTPLVGVTDGTVQWALHVGNVGDMVSNQGNVYQMLSGTFTAYAGTGPTGTGNSITDSTVTWGWVGAQTAPSITLSSTHNAALGTIYNKANYPNWNTDGGWPIRVSGGIPGSMVGVTGLDANSWCCVSTNVAPSAGSAGSTYNASVAWTMEMIAEASKVEFELIPNNTNYISALMDAQYIDYQIPAMSTSTFSHLYWTFDFTNVVSQLPPGQAKGRARHRLAVEMSGSHAPFSFACATTDSLSYPTFGNNYSYAYISDSQGGAPNCVQQQCVFSNQVKHLLGLTDMMNHSVGNTGMVMNSGGQVFNTYAPTMIGLLNQFRPCAAVFIQMSQNDGGGTFDSQLPAATVQLVASIRAKLPSVPIVFIGQCRPNGTTAEQAVITTVNNLGDTNCFAVPVWTAANVPPWINGTGSAGAPNGTGNADIDIGADGAHFSTAGELLWGYRSAWAILQVIQSKA